MYINKDVYEENKLSSSELFSLFMVNQKEKCVDNLAILHEKGYISFTKAGEARITPSGKELLERLTTPFVEEQDEIIYQWLATKYEEAGKEIGNHSKTKKWIAEFRAKSNIEKNNLALLCKTFLDDNKNMEYNNKLEFAFFKPANAFATRFKLEESRLYQYYLKNKKYFDSKFTD